MILINIEIKKAFRITKDGKVVNIGNGIFTKHLIAKGTIIYRESEFLQVFRSDQMDKFSEIKREWIQKYAAYRKDGNYWRLPTDDARFWNHSNKSNVRYRNEESQEMIAVTNILPGEEITCDYREFCDHCKDGNFGFDII